jgi:hypothetical protein
MGGTGASSGSSGSGYSYGNGKAIGIGVGVAAGAVVGTVLLVRHHRHHEASSQALLIGCTQSQPNGISLENEEDGTTYMLAGKPVEPRQRVELEGVVKNDGPGGSTFRVRAVVTNFGACSASHVASTQNPEGN